jgi:hypothetical protein
MGYRQRNAEHGNAETLVGEGKPLRNTEQHNEHAQDDL